MPASWIHRAMFLACGATSLAACSGGYAGGLASAPPPSIAPSAAPAPAPAPTPSPTPAPAPSPAPTVATQPTVATIFRDPLYNPELAVVGKGWQHEYVPNQAGALKLRDADDFSVSYDVASKSYQISVPVAGSGTIMRTSEYGTYPWGYASALPGFSAEPSSKSPTNYCCEALSISASDHPQSQYSYVSFVDFFAPGPTGSNTIAYGTFAVAQPTKIGEVPVTGTARYTGTVFGHFAGDAGATWVEGTSRFDFDFAQVLLTGDVTLSMRCIMGCSYENYDITYNLTNTIFSRGSTTFSGSLTATGIPSNGTFAGLFAGPGAVEMLAQFEAPFFNPEFQRWMTAGGAIAGKRD